MAHSFNGFSAGIHRKHLETKISTGYWAVKGRSYHVIPKHSRHHLGKLSKDSIVESTGREGELLGLGHQGGDYAGVAVSLSSQIC